MNDNSPQALPKAKTAPSGSPALKKLLCFYLSLAVTVLCAGIFVGHLHRVQPPSSGPLVRFAINPTLLAKHAPDRFFPDPESYRPRPSPARAGRVDEEAYVRDADDFIFVAMDKKAGGFLRFAQGRVFFSSLDGSTEITPLGRSAATLILAPHDEPDIFQANFFAPPMPNGEKILVPPLDGEEWDEDGVPLRWRKMPGDVEEKDVLACGPDRYYINLMRLIGRGFAQPGSGFAAAGPYKNAVGRYAEKYNLSPALVLAVMHTESNFNPLAVSRSRAVGLMQIVPDSAGSEAHRYLTGSRSTPGLDILMSPERNISYGTAYLHLLGRRYFSGVKNIHSRQICIIAAYNGGPGAVLRHFDPSDDKSAVDRINAMSPDQLYTHMTTQMPNSETRRYVELVLGRMRTYSVN
jgi:membrane-bound lytic murein transglycosylase C